MRKVKLTIELEYDDEIMHHNDNESIKWFNDEILTGEKGLLSLYSNEVGDTLGKVKVLNIINDEARLTHTEK